ncbi:MAG: hypothetical protein INR65_18860 [Gluconacetobacter diazotrophicus]|nr:hypothetical protein [Gluconacetobacter diazotrophicus]
MATTVRLQPGGTAEIVLRATGALGKPIGFLLRTRPVHGTFADVPRRLDRDSVVVTYVHRAADGPGRDEFTFAAQAPGTAVSAAETVDIEIAGAPVEDPAPAGVPDLAARPSELDFGAVENGDSSGLTLTVENRGDGLAVGQLDPPLPWSVDGDAGYHLARGARQTFRLVFRPRAEGAFAETLRVDAGNGKGTSGCIVRLVGTGLPATARAQLTPPPPPPAATPPPVVAKASAAPAPSAAPTPDRSAPVPAAPTTVEPGVVLTNEARVTKLKVVAVSSSTVELTWQQPVPLPRSYRVERRSFARDERAQGGVRVDWLPYDRVDFRTRGDQVTARLHGFAPGDWVSVRVVSVDVGGQLSRPSPLVNVLTLPGQPWWHPTVLKTLLLALAVCVGLIVRRRWQERRLLEELDSRHLDDESAGEPEAVGKADSFRSSL